MMNAEQVVAFFNWASSGDVDIALKDYALLIAASTGHTFFVSRFLQEGRNTDFGRTYAFIEAARKGHTAALLLLLPYCTRQMPLDFALVEASGAGHFNCVQYLRPYCSEKTHSIAFFKSLNAQQWWMSSYWMSLSTLEIAPEDVLALMGAAVDLTSCTSLTHQYAYNDAAILGQWDKMQRLSAFCDPSMRGVALLQAAVRGAIVVVQNLAPQCAASDIVMALIQAANQEQDASVCVLKTLCSTSLLAQVKYCALLQDNWKVLASLEKIHRVPFVYFSGNIERSEGVELAPSAANNLSSKLHKRK